MKILGVRIDSCTKSELRTIIADALGHSKKTKVSKINSEFLYRAMNDKSFLKTINYSDLNIVDGRGVLWAARYLTLPISNNKIIGNLQSIWQMFYSCVSIIFHPKFITYPLSETIPGVIAFYLMMEIASDQGVGVFLFGSSADTLEKSIKKIINQFPNLKISGYLNGYDYQNNSSIDVISEINKTDAKILIVSLGSPKQEYWISDNMDKLKNIRIAVGEGGTLDRVANPTQKSPQFLNNIGLEWLWRTLFNNSKRNRLRRFWNSVPAFIFSVVKWKMKNGQTKI